MVIISLIAVLMIGFVWQKVELNQLVTEIEQLQDQEQELWGIIENQQAEKYKLKNDERIINIATGTIQMSTTPPFSY